MPGQLPRRALNGPCNYTDHYRIGFRAAVCGTPRPDFNNSVGYTLQTRGLTAGVSALLVAEMSYVVFQV